MLDQPTEGCLDFLNRRIPQTIGGHQNHNRHRYGNHEREQRSAAAKLFYSSFPCRFPPFIHRFLSQTQIPTGQRQQVADLEIADVLGVFAFLVGLVDLFQELAQINGFDDIVKGTELHAGDAGIKGAMAGEKDHLDARVSGLNLRQNFKAGHIGHIEIEDDNIRLQASNGWHGVFTGKHAFRLDLP